MGWMLVPQAAAVLTMPQQPYVDTVCISAAIFLHLTPKFFSWAGNKNFNSGTPLRWSHHCVVDNWNFFPPVYTSVFIINLPLSYLVPAYSGIFSTIPLLSSVRSVVWFTQVIENMRYPNESGILCKNMVHAIARDWHAAASVWHPCALWPCVGQGR